MAVRVAEAREAAAQVLAADLAEGVDWAKVVGLETLRRAGVGVERAGFEEVLMDAATVAAKAPNLVAGLAAALGVVGGLERPEVAGGEVGRMGRSGEVALEVATEAESGEDWEVAKAEGLVGVVGLAKAAGGEGSEGWHRVVAARTERLSAVAWGGAMAAEPVLG